MRELVRAVEASLEGLPESKAEPILLQPEMIVRQSSVAPEWAGQMSEMQKA